MQNVLLTYENSLRQTGRTTRLTEKAVKTGATVVCGSHGLAHMIRTDHGVSAICIDDYLNPDYQRGRRKTTYLFDSTAELVLITRKLQEVEDIMAWNL